jgi:general secretion pathway protein G
MTCTPPQTRWGSTACPTANGEIMKRLSSSSQIGFTLIELLVVLAIVAMLLTLSMPRYFQSVESSKQTILADNLRQTREIIDKYYGDTGHYPATLQELVDKQYLKALPFDPVASSAMAWVIVPPPAGKSGAVYDIKSAAPGLNRFGVAFSDL